MDGILMDRFHEIAEQQLNAVGTLEAQIKAVVEEYVRAEGYVMLKLESGAHCPTCTCGKHG